MNGNGNGKRAREEAFEAAVASAIVAGREAARATRPTPMVVTEHEDQLDDSSPARREWFVPSGVCGFGWVTVRPGRSAFARWLVRRNLAYKAYGGGVTLRIEHGIPGYEQSLEMNEAFAYGAAKKLRELGFNAYGESRID